MENSVLDEFIIENIETNINENIPETNNILKDKPNNLPTLIQSNKFYNNKISKENNGDIFVVGIIQKAGIKNENGRIYPKQILQRAIAQYKMKMVETGQAFGELDHPDASIVSLKHTSHRIVDIWWENDIEVWAKIKILSTYEGENLKRLFEEGVPIGISSRGLGSTSKKNGVDIVNDDLQFICWDFVSIPSTPGAFMNLLKQSKDFNIKNNDIMVYINDTINNILQNLQ